jgi:hypothetical protein
MRPLARLAAAGGIVIWAAWATLAPPGSASDVFEKLGPGHWYEVPNSELRAVLPSPRPAGDPLAIMEAWSGGTYDPVRDALVLAANGGHADYGGNEVYAFSLSSLSWQRLTDPSMAPLPPVAVEALPDGRPSSRHTYSGVTFHVSADKVFISGGSLWSATGGGSRGAWTFDVPARAWERRADAPGSQVTAMVAYDPVTGLVFSLLQNGTLAAYDYKKNSWAKRASMGGWAEFDPARTMVMHPTRRQLLVVGGGKVLAFGLSQFSGTQTIATTGGEAIVNAQGPGLAYDSANNCIVAWTGGDVYSLDLATRVWERHAPVGPAAPPIPPRQGVFGRWQYIPSRDAFIVATRVNENVWLYRLPPSRRCGG